MRKKTRNHPHWVSLDKGSTSTEHYFWSAKACASYSCFWIFLSLSLYFKSILQRHPSSVTLMFHPVALGLASHEILASIYFSDIPTLEITLNPPVFLHSTNSDSLTKFFSLNSKVTFHNSGKMLESKAWTYSINTQTEKQTFFLSKNFKNLQKYTFLPSGKCNKNIMIQLELRDSGAGTIGPPAQEDSFDSILHAQMLLRTHIFLVQ